LAEIGKRQFRSIRRLAAARLPITNFDAIRLFASPSCACGSDGQMNGSMVIDNHKPEHSLPAARFMANRPRIESRIWSNSTRPQASRRDVSFRLRRGSITGLSAQRGAGKTTTSDEYGLRAADLRTHRGARPPMARRGAEVLGRMTFRGTLCRQAMRLHGAAESDRFLESTLLRQGSAARIPPLASDIDLKEFLDRANANSAARRREWRLAESADKPDGASAPGTSLRRRSILDTRRLGQAASRDLSQDHNATSWIGLAHMLEVERLCTIASCSLLCFFH